MRRREMESLVIEPCGVDLRNLGGELRGVDSGAGSSNEDVGMELSGTAPLCLEMAATDITATDGTVRFAEVAFRLGLETGCAVNMLAGWDTEDEDLVEELDRAAKEETPHLSIGSPPCEEFSPRFHIPE